jgi:putative nucleotidyltransferase with HDIG domain
MALSPRQHTIKIDKPRDRLSPLRVPSQSKPRIVIPALPLGQLVAPPDGVYKLATSPGMTKLSLDSTSLEALPPGPRFPKQTPAEVAAFIRTGDNRRRMRRWLATGPMAAREAFRGEMATCRRSGGLFRSLGAKRLEEWSRVVAGAAPDCDVAKLRCRERRSHSCSFTTATPTTVQFPLSQPRFHIPMLPSRTEQLALVREYTQSESLIKHMLAVESAVRAYARKWGEDEELWGAVGLLHDFDYERWPNPPDHPLQGSRILAERGYPQVLIYAIKSHADYLTDCPRLSRLDKTLYACDELCGFLTASALVRPGRLEGLDAKSVKKKLKQLSFAAAVNRDDITRGAADLGVDLDEHINFCIAAMQTIAPELGLLPQPAPPPA